MTKTIMLERKKANDDSDVFEDKTSSEEEKSDYLLNDDINYYLNKVTEGKLLTHEEEIALAGLVRQGDSEARKKFTMKNTKLVVSIAKTFQGHGVLLPDLIQEGNIGLITAVEKYDPAKGFRFSTYAVSWIKQAINRAIEMQGRTIRHPSYVVQTVNRIEKMITRFEVVYGREPTCQEIADELELTPEKVRQILSAPIQPKSLSYPLVSHFDSTENDYLTDIIEDDTAPDPTKNIIASEEEIMVWRMLYSLPKKQWRDILIKRMGFDDGEKMTLVEIGRCYKITRERVRQIEAKAIKWLQKAFRESFTEYFSEY